jgi:hypothetical protein
LNPANSLCEAMGGGKERVGRLERRAYSSSGMKAGMPMVPSRFKYTIPGFSLRLGIAMNPHPP